MPSIKSKLYSKLESRRKMYIIKLTLPSTHYYSLSHNYFVTYSKDVLTSGYGGDDDDTKKRTHTRKKKNARKRRPKVPRM